MGLQCLAVLLSNGMPAYDTNLDTHINMNTYFKAICAPLEGKHRAVMRTSAEVLGLIFADARNEQTLGKRECVDQVKSHIQSLYRGRDAQYEFMLLILVKIGRWGRAAGGRVCVLWM